MYRTGDKKTKATMISLSQGRPSGFKKGGTPGPNCAGFNQRLLRGPASQAIRESPEHRRESPTHSRMPALCPPRWHRSVSTCLHLLILLSAEGQGGGHARVQWQ